MKYERELFVAGKCFHTRPSQFLSVLDLLSKDFSELNRDKCGTKKLKLFLLSSIQEKKRRIYKTNFLFIKCEYFKNKKSITT